LQPVGQVQSIRSIPLNLFFFIGQMIVPGSSYWNIGMGLGPGDVKKDKEGLATMKTLGTNMAWLMKKLEK
jgi:multimeric flavodoxin WrbA